MGVRVMWGRVVVGGRRVVWLSGSSHTASASTHTLPSRRIRFIQNVSFCSERLCNPFVYFVYTYRYFRQLLWLFIKKPIALKQIYGLINVANPMFVRAFCRICMILPTDNCEHVNFFDKGSFQKKKN